MRPRILRLAGEDGLLTAEVFEALFARHLGQAFDVRYAPVTEWCDAVLGTGARPRELTECGERLAEATRDVDFLCPNYQGIMLAPLLLAARNRAGARVRLLLIAHAAGAYSVEWALLRPLLHTGDVIIAPSEGAASAITALCPSLATHVRVVCHPMAPLPPCAERETPPSVVSIGRIHPGKLLHRQIEAMAVLRARGRPLPRMDIVGALDEGQPGRPRPYSIALGAKIRRLGLGSTVRLVGAVRGADAKARVLAGARLLLNLSCTVEESFPKTPVEALGAGVPVLGTDWIGVRDTVGDCGALVPMSVVGAGYGEVDVEPERIADALERLLADPPSSDTCRERAARFRPEVATRGYRSALEDALDALGSASLTPSWPDAGERAAPDDGLLAGVTPLIALSWQEMFDRYVASSAAIRAEWTGASPAPSVGALIRAMIGWSVQPALKRIFGRLPMMDAPRARQSGRARTVVDGGDRRADDSLAERLAAAAEGPGLGCARVATLRALAMCGHAVRVPPVLPALARDGVPDDELHSLRIDVLHQQQHVDAAATLAFARVAAHPPVEVEHQRVRQLARAARAASRHAEAIRVLSDWLASYPDGPESGPVWLECGVTASRAGAGWAPIAHVALGHAERLLGEMPAVLKAREALQRRAPVSGPGPVSAPRSPSPAPAH